VGLGKPKERVDRRSNWSKEGAHS